MSTKFFSDIKTLSYRTMTLIISLTQPSVLPSLIRIHNHMVQKCKVFRLPELYGAVKSTNVVTSARAGVQNSLDERDPRLRGDDGNEQNSVYYSLVNPEKRQHWRAPTLTCPASGSSTTLGSGGWR